MSNATADRRAPAPRLCLLLSATGLLCSCGITVEQAAINLGEDQRTSYSAVITGRRDDAARIAKLRQDIERCGMQVRPYETEDKPNSLAVNLHDIQTQDIGTYMACLPGGGRVSVQPKKEVGWFYTYYDLDVQVALPRCTLRPIENDREGRMEARHSPSASILPRSFAFQLPGRISSSELVTDVQEMAFHKSDDGSVTTITSTPPKAYLGGAWLKGQAYCRRFVPRSAGGFVQRFETESFHATIHSKQATFNLSTLLTVAGLLISSGVVAAIVRRLVNRPAPVPATGEAGGAPPRKPGRRKGSRR